ncbi:dihydrodipicolinate synthase family protein [Halopelagius longus]|uniref:4-hydroxy-tetrahydrodipicolinate synthase n=1 Tax=Halopelagius longus TaxID=1236180 RepID=A0A1H1G356_9EURY|nr:dihydrodipicolinate synthase family protein [Halopelagius longus]RDI69870.1 dihydrodipicolinate synthase family protein [Halopelagius longus]SDR07664.1 4-hydroxy-tetrahydrodipicolinate synthase [Halopelagius longus]
MRESYKQVKDAIKGGVIPATVTPLTPDLEVAEDDLYGHIRNLTSTDGIVATVANAHSGECKMSPPEDKERVIEIHQEASEDAMVFSGIHGESTAMAVEEARRAEAAGADALMPVPIDVYSHGDPDIIVEYYSDIADAVDIPLIAFQFGNFGDIAQPVSAYVELCKLDGVVALKNATFDVTRYEETVRALEPYRDEFTLMTGEDVFLYHSYLLGAETALISYANLVPDMHVEKLRAVREGDIERARELRSEMLPLTNFLFGEPVGRNRNRIKAALQMQGVFEHDTVRPPAQTLDPEERDRLREILQDMDRL